MVLFILEDFSGLEKIERAINESPKNVSNDSSAFALDQLQVQNDLSAINRLITGSSKTAPSVPEQLQPQQVQQISEIIL